MTGEATNLFTIGDAVTANPALSLGGPNVDVIALWTDSRPMPRSPVNADTTIRLSAVTITGLEPVQADGEPPAGPPGDVPARPPGADAPAAPAAAQDPEVEEIRDENGVLVQRHLFGRNFTGMTTDYDTAGNIARLTIVKENNTLEVTDFSPNETVTTTYDFTNNRVVGATINHRDGSVTPFDLSPAPGQPMPRPRPYVRQ